MRLELEEEIKTKLADWRSMIAEYQIPSTKKAVIQMVNTFLPFLGLWVLMYFSLNWSIWITLLLAFVNAFFMVRIFIIQHDCGHQSFTVSKKANNIIGFVCSLFCSLPFKYWARIHNYHHGHTGQLEERDIGDIDFLTVQEFKSRGKWGRLKYRLFRHPLTLFGFVPIYYFVIANRFPKTEFKGFRKRFKWSQIRNNLAILMVYSTLAWLLGWQKFLFIQLSIIFIFAVIAFWFFYVQHTHEQTYHTWRKNWDFLLASVRGATYYKLPKLFQWLTGNIGIHHIHHLSSLIPNYNLEKCMKDNPLLTQYTSIITFRESLQSVSNKLWDEQKQMMISFKEFYRMERQGLLGS